MTYDPDAAARWAEATRAAAADAESALIARTAAELAGGIDDNPYWAASKREQLAAFRRSLDDVIGPALQGIGDVAGAAVAGAATDAAAAAAAEVTSVLVGAAEEFADRLPGSQAFLALTREAIDQPAAAARTAIEGMNHGILRDIDDAYRRVIADVESRVLLGAQTQREVAQEALDRWATMGITGFTDRAGRRWDLASYAEMATRTAAQRAALEAHNEQLQAMGVDLAFVSDAPQECKRCRPWEGKIIALRGGAGRRTVEHEITGKPVEIVVAGTVADARSGGLWHPNCRHTMDGYFPGVTRVPTDTEDPEGDRARQRLRELERRVRRAKREQAAAITPTAAARARAKVRARQADIRAHVDASPGLLRQPHREQLMTGRPQPGTRPDLAPLPRGGGPGPADTPGRGRTLTPREQIEAGDLSGLRRVGGQAGSNEGGLYEDADGNQWYVKAPRTADHAANEALAADLYRAAGIDVPEVRLGRGAPGLPDRQLIASRIVPDATSDLREQLGRNRRYGQQAREGFAVDAWLGNWDVAGQAFDNIVTSRGKPVRIDVGGSLLFRAQGQPKGPAFGDRVNEWSTLRDPSNPEASTLFAGLTDREIIASAERVGRVKPEQIRDLVAARGLPGDLADTLIARRDDITRRATTLRRRVEFDARVGRAAKGPTALDTARQGIPTVESGRPQVLAHRPSGWTDKQYEDRSAAAVFYRDEEYAAVNAYFRSGEKGLYPKESEDLRAAFEGSELERDVVTHRGIRRPDFMFGDKWQENGDMSDVEWTEEAFSSTSSDPRVADSFAETGRPPTVMRFLLPRGTRAMRLSDQAPQDRRPLGIHEEAELLVDVGARYRVIRDYGLVDGTRRMDVEVIL